MINVNGKGRLTYFLPNPETMMVLGAVALVGFAIYDQRVRLEKVCKQIGRMEHAVDALRYTPATMATRTQEADPAIVEAAVAKYLRKARRQCG